MKTIKLINGMTLIAALVVAPAAFAANPPDVTAALVGSTALELPVKAANLVAQASAADRQDVAVAVVKAALGMNPKAAAAIVSAVAQKNPTVAPIVALTAATLQHKQIGLITRIAVAAAPSQALKIVAALLKEFPQDYNVIAVAASESAPSYGREILLVVGDTIPGLQFSILGAVANIAPSTANVPVQSILSQTGVPNLTTSGTSPVPSLSPPSLGPPYTPIVGPVTVVTPADTQPQTPGARTYSAP